MRDRLRDVRPRLRRAPEQEALAEADAQPHERLELLERLDALGADARPHATGEHDEELDQGRLRRVEVHALDQAAVELDQVGVHPHDLLEAGVARAGVVHRYAGAAAAQLGEAVLESAVLGGQLVLGDLDDDVGEVVG